MNILKKINLGKRILAGSAVLLLFFVGAILVGFKGLSDAADAEALIDLRYQQIRLLEELKLMNTELTLLYMDIIIDKEAGDVSTERKEWLNAFKKELDADEKRITATADTELEKKNSGEIFKNLKEMVRVGDEELIPGVVRKEEDAAFWGRMDDTLDQLGDKNSRLLGEVINSISGEVEKAKTESMATKRQARLNLILLFGIGLVISAFLSFIIRGSIVRPVRAMIERAKNLSSGEVDMRKRLKVETLDEIGELGGWFNKFLDRLEILIGKVKERSGGLGASTEDIARGSEDLSTRTNEQAASLTQTSATVEEFATILKHNRENSEQTASTLEAFNTEVRNRQELIVNVTETMTEINESSRKIDNIVNVINDISFQTNLLALNAAVEAARAGEAGRGFAVVAAEVRNLAQKTAESSKTIREIVTQNVESTQKGMELIRETSGFFESVVKTLEEISVNIREIAQSSREQSTGVEQINGAVGQLETVVNQNAALVEELSATGRTLKAGANELVDLVGHFKTEGDTAEAGVPKPSPTPKPAKPKAAAPETKKAETKKEELKNTDEEEDFFAQDGEDFEEF